MGNTSTKPLHTLDGGKFHPNGIYPSDAQDFDAKIVQKLIMQRLLSPFYKGSEDPDPDPFAKNSQTPNSPGIQSTNDTDDDGWWSYRLHIDSSSQDDTQINKGAYSQGSNVNTAFGSPSTNTLAAGNKLSAAVSHQPCSTQKTLRVNVQNSSTYSTGLSDDFMQPSAKSDSSSYSNAWAKNLYRRVVECPICFLYYPKNINYSNCCHKPICTECFIQIKRNDELLSPAHCPYCVEPDFGIVYYPPREVIGRLEQRPGHKKAKSSVSSMAVKVCQPTTSQSKPSNSRQRSKTASGQEPQVVFSDDIRPNLLKQLTAAKEKREREEQRRNAAFAVLAAATQRASQMGAARRSRGSGSTGSQTPGIQSVNGRSGRSGRRGGVRQVVRIPSEYGSYLAAMRASGGQNLEEFLIQEAIRQSLEDMEGPSSSTSTTNPAADTPQANTTISAGSQDQTARTSSHAGSSTSARPDCQVQIQNTKPGVGSNSKDSPADNVMHQSQQENGTSSTVEDNKINAQTGGTAQTPETKGTTSISSTRPVSSSATAKNDHVPNNISNASTFDMDCKTTTIRTITTSSDREGGANEDGLQRKCNDNNSISPSLVSL
ncbi:SNF1-interacting protein [Mycoemilia scoparia]|uniref:SNF1-interacting protein n=1 Tax=Mycoemilia scoparia TaxID=417184 RepID=A0A9W7ZXL6_9FUNG|nr:SNF1-interacting protein [Mycoemilia scoparia]